LKSIFLKSGTCLGIEKDILSWICVFCFDRGPDGGAGGSSMVALENHSDIFAEKTLHSIV
jgi:hypothetical protein